MNPQIVGLGDYSRAAYAPGDQGIAQSVQLVVTKVRESYLRAIGDPNAKLRGWLGKALMDGGRPRDVRGKARAIMAAVNKQTMYLADPVGVEYVPTPEAMLCLDPNVCTPADDCDGRTTLCTVLMLLAGIPTRLVKQKWNGVGMQHILLAIEDENDDWLGVDPSTDLPIGRRHKADEEVWIDPLEGVAPEIVGIGAPLARHRDSYEMKWGKLWRAVPGVPGGWAEVSLGGLLEDNHLGATADPYTTAYSDLSNQVQAVITAGDQYLAAKEYSSAVQSYQAAGMAGATSVGPEIDLAGAPNVTQPITQTAWTVNAQLAAIASTNATAATASQAQTLAKQMLDLYVNAISAGRTALQNTAPTATPGAEGGIGAPAAIGIAVGIAALVGLAIGVHKRAHPTLPRKRSR